MEGADLVVSAVPCQFMRRVWERLRGFVPQDVPILSVAKGIENGTLARPTRIIADVLGRDSRLAALSGPTIADELARKLPATACIACVDENLAGQLQRALSVRWLRIYTNTDIVGVELAGAMKNVIAIAAGIVEGMGLGDNAKAALLARGLAEISRLGVACGARSQTFAGLAGLGDLVTTCISSKGRNRTFGEKIGRYSLGSRPGRSVPGPGGPAADAYPYSLGGKIAAAGLQDSPSVVEGIATCRSVVALAAKMGVEIPITQAVYDVLFEDKPVKTAVADLMERRLKAE
jgi:glycerol-3-phosphate dehydrogenase (NAD(P)+)